MSVKNKDLTTVSHTLSVILVEIAFFVWVCGNAPEWIRAWVSLPMPHSLRNVVAPIVGLLAGFFFIKVACKILYRDINQSEADVYYNQSVFGYFVQIVISVLIGLTSYPVIHLLSSWSLIYNYLFAIGVGSFAYMVIDSLFIRQGEILNVPEPEPEPGPIIRSHRGQKPAKQQDWEGFIKETKPPIRETKRQAQVEQETLDRQRERIQRLLRIPVLVIQIVIDGISSWVQKTVQKTKERKEKQKLLASPPKDDVIEADVSGYEAEGWKDLELNNFDSWKERKPVATPKKTREE